MEPSEWLSLPVASSTGEIKKPIPANRSWRDKGGNNRLGLFRQCPARAIPLRGQTRRNSRRGRVIETETLNGGRKFRLAGQLGRVISNGMLHFVNPRHLLAKARGMSDYLLVGKVGREEELLGHKFTRPNAQRGGPEFGLLRDSSDECVKLMKVFH